MDHGLPFARWPNNDLWNLLPVNPAVNSEKSNKLVSAEKLEQARLKAEETTRVKAVEWVSSTDNRSKVRGQVGTIVAVIQHATSYLTN